MHKSPSPLPEEVRAKIAETLNARLAERIEKYLEGARESRSIAEKHAWFLRASLEE